MSRFIRKGSAAALTVFVLLASQSVFGSACILGECSAMTTEFRNLELRPKSIALLPAILTLVEKGVFNSKEKVGETAILEAAPDRYCINDRGCRSKICFTTATVSLPQPSLRARLNCIRMLTCHSGCPACFRVCSTSS